MKKNENHAQEKNSSDERSGELEPKPLSHLSHLMSVITPSHNDKRYLRRVVLSVAAQTVPVLEHIIIDDGSIDGSDEILQELQLHFSHLIVVTQSRKGAAASRNRGIEMARGRYIAFLDADDSWNPRKVERQVRCMEEHGYLFTYGDYQEIDYYQHHILKRLNLPKRVTHTQLLRGCPIGCLTAAYNQEVLGKHYLPLVESGNDWGLWLELTSTGIYAYKYDGLEASYSNGRISLSTSKLKKVINVYRIYHRQESLSRFSAVLRTLQHSFTALAKKLRLIYH